MGCKSDDTCEQSATKGELENLTSLLVVGFTAVYALVWINNSKLSRVQRHTDAIHRYGTIGANHMGSLRDQQAIRELLDESPASRKKLIRWEKARQWDEIMDIAEEKEWLEQQEWYDGTNPYRN